MTGESVTTTSPAPPSTRTRPTLVVVAALVTLAALAARRRSLERCGARRVPRHAVTDVTDWVPVCRRRGRHDEHRGRLDRRTWGIRWRDDWEDGRTR